MRDKCIPQALPSKLRIIVKFKPVNGLVTDNNVHKVNALNL